MTGFIQKFTEAFAQGKSSLSPRTLLKETCSIYVQYQEGKLIEITHAGCTHAHTKTLYTLIFVSAPYCWCLLPSMVLYNYHPFIRISWTPKVHQHTHTQYYKSAMQDVLCSASVVPAELWSITVVPGTSTLLSTSSVTETPGSCDCSKSSKNCPSL